MIVDVPVFNEDGSVKFTASLNEKETQAILQFGLNFAIAAGLSQEIGLHGYDDEDTDAALND